MNRGTAITLACATAATLLISAGGMSQTPATEPPQRHPGASTAQLLLNEFRAICLDEDGDLEVSEEVALERGYAPAPDLVPPDLFQGRTFQVWNKFSGESELRVVVKPGGFNQGAVIVARHTRCHVSLDPADFRSTRAAMRDYMGFDHFAQRDSSVFVWVPTTEGGRRPVARNRFENALVRLSNEEGLRMILVGRHNDHITLTYISPRDAAGDPVGGFQPVTPAAHGS